jgi:hypothetical protein
MRGREQAGYRSATARSPISPAPGSMPSPPFSASPAARTSNGESEAASTCLALSRSMTGSVLRMAGSPMVYQDRQLLGRVQALGEVA